MLHAEDRTRLFEVPDFKELPPQVEVISKKKIDGVTVTELSFAGAPFNGKATRIYGYYAKPAGSKKVPAVVQLHGAGLNVLDSKAAVFYAKNGFSCLSIDWAGPALERKEPRKPPFSIFESPGNIAGEVEKGKPWKMYGPEVDGITNGVRFVMRSFMFLRDQPEVDSGKLFLSGMSAGAHLSLLVIGQNSSIKGAAVKYGCGFIRDVPDYFGGYFGPLTLTSTTEQDEWLKVLDPAVNIANYKASVLLLSGTDDIFFRMPLVLMTYRAIKTPKALVMLPNDNHTEVNNEQIPARWFRAVLGEAPALPLLGEPRATNEKGKLVLTVKVEGAKKISKVTFHVKRMPVAEFKFDASQGTKWEPVSAKLSDGMWSASVPPPAAEEQLVAYATALDITGNFASSDTVEMPDYPKWRGTSAQ